MSKKLDIPGLYTFGDMKARFQNLVVENDYFQFLRAVEQMMFEYTGLPENIDPYRLEDFLNLTGGCVWKVVDGVHMVAPYPARQGQIDMWGYGEVAHSTTLNGISLEGVVGVDAAVIYNNTTRTPQTDLYTTADIFSEIDNSSRKNVRFAKIAPILEAANSKQQKALEELISVVLEGEVKTVVSDADVKLNDLVVANAEKGLHSVEAITAPEKIQYLQYLSQYFDIRMRRHFARRGLSMKTSDKQAQVTRDEVHGMDAMTWVYPLSKLAARRKGLEMVNKIYGTNIAVDFSELWMQEWNAYKLRSAAEDAEEQRAEDELKAEGDSSNENAETENSPE